MRNSYKVLTAVAVAGLAFAGGSAFTGAGLSTTAPTTQFVGGTVSQTVEGATLSNIAYGFVDGPTGPQTSVNQVTLTFTAIPTDKSAAIVLKSGAATVASKTCEQNATDVLVYDCDLTATPASGVDSIAVTVS